MEQRTYLAFLVTSGHSRQPTFKPSTAPAAPPYYIVAAKRKAPTEKLANMPANQLFSLLFSIEQATVAIARKHTRLTDKEVEAVYLSYRDYFKAVRSGKELEPPTSTINMKDDLFNEIWEVLLMREDNGHDEQFCNGSWSPGGTPVTSVEQLYIMAFNEVRKSVRLWRKEDGRKNYLKHIQAHVAEHIPLEITSHHPTITDGADGQEYEELTKERPDYALAKSEYDLLLTLEDVRGMPPGGGS